MFLEPVVFVEERRKLIVLAGPEGSSNYSMDFFSSFDLGDTAKDLLKTAVSQVE